MILAMTDTLFPKARKIFRAAIAAVEPGALLRRNISRNRDRLVLCGRIYDLTSFQRIFLAAIGKAAPSMAREVASLLGERSVVVYQAIGWLAHEGRIEYLQEHNQVYISKARQ